MSEDKVKIPPRLRKGDKFNFATLRQAHNDGQLALVSAIRKSDQKAVALVCAMSREGGDIMPIPLAVMVEGNPFELFEDPTVFAPLPPDSHVTSGTG